MSVCLSCARHLHDECENYNWAANVCCCNGAGVGDSKEVVDSTGKRDGMAWSKHDGNIIDAKSTGRKRAAKIYPLDPNSPCEWRGLLYSGGGMFPIIGCTGGLQEHRHHGPNLSTLDNTEGNVHRICTTCHNRWHTDNDAFIKHWDATILWRPHDPNSMAEQDILALASADSSYSRSRYKWEAYIKAKHDYRDYLRDKEGSA